jgi:hypothetical protein
MVLTRGHVVDAAYPDRRLGPVCSLSGNTNCKVSVGCEDGKIQLRQNVNELQQENNNLAASVDKLEDTSYQVGS